MGRQTLSAAAVAGMLLLPGCSHGREPVAQAASAREEGRHATAHGGVLNAIQTCETGHAETKLEDGRLWVWFVGGGSQTTAAETVPDRVIRLTVRGPSGAPRYLRLDPRPLELAGERPGACSRFAGAAPWLEGERSWTAEGNVRFKGEQRPLRIEYPAGYDPDSQPAQQGAEGAGSAGK